MAATTIEYASDAPTKLATNLPYPRLPAHYVVSSTGKPDYLRLILTSKVYDCIKETPLVLAHNLSAKLGNEIWLKREDLQDVFSFKIRGAYNFMASLTEEERWKGVITCSAGNIRFFYKGLAYQPGLIRQSCTGRCALWFKAKRAMHYRHAQGDPEHQSAECKTIGRQDCFVRKRF